MYRWKKSVKDHTGIMGNYTVYNETDFNTIPANAEGGTPLTYDELKADASGMCM